MSFLSRLSARARPQVSATPLLMPKGFVARHPGAVYREEAAQAGEEEEVAPRAMRAGALRREQPQAPEEGEEEVARAAAPKETEEQPADEMQPLRRAAGAETEPAEPDEEMRPLRRAAAPATEAAEVDEEMRAVRRAAPAAGEEGEDEGEVQAARLIRRAEEVPLDDADKPLRQPFQSDLEPRATPPHPDLAAEEEPSDLQALRRNATPQLPTSVRPDGPGRAAQGPALPEIVSSFDTGFGDRSDGTGAAAYFEPRYGSMLEPRGSAGANAERSPVIIDQLDVLIHEPAAPPSAARSADHGRMLRARYLRRL